MSATLPEIAEAIVLRPGDKLLLRMPDGTSEEDLERSLSIVKAAWPDVPVLVVAGDVTIEVVQIESVDRQLEDMIHDLEKEK